MPKGWLGPGAFALSILMISICSGCTPSKTALYQAASEQGRAAAKVILPPLPAECRQQVEHAPVAIGDNPVIVLARERSQLGVANGVIGRCADNYDRLKVGLEEVAP